MNSRNQRAMEQSRNRIARTWRVHLVDKLQHSYGLTREQAKMRADVWLQWIREQPSLWLESLVVADVGDKRKPSGLDSRSRPTKSRAAVAPSL
jgi:hypothetical protein